MTTPVKKDTLRLLIIDDLGLRSYNFMAHCPNVAKDGLFVCLVSCFIFNFNIFKYFYFLSVTLYFQYYITFRGTEYYLDINIIYEVITPIILVPTWHYT